MTIARSLLCSPLWLAPVSMLSLGCGEDERPAASWGGGGMLDASVDASIGQDARSEASVPEYGGCAGDELTFSGAQVGGVSFGAAIRANRVDLAYLVTGCGDAPGVSASRELMHVGFATSGAADGPTAVGPKSLESCVRVRELALTASAGRVDLFYTSSTNDAPELYHEELSVPAPPAPLTSRPELELRLVSAVLRGSEIPTAVFTRELNLDRPPVATAIASAQPGRADVEVLPVSAGHHPARLALAAAGGAASAEIRGVASWTSDLDPHRGVYLRRLDAAGQGIGDSVALSAGAGSASQVALAPGAVVYTRAAPSEDREALVFRALGEDGTPGPEVLLTTLGQNIAEVAVAAYGDGYAVVYRRAREPEAPAEPTLRLMFLDRHGTPAGARVVATTSATIAGLQLLAGRDGRLVVLWADQPAFPLDEVTIRARRLLCR